MTRGPRPSKPYNTRRRRAQHVLVGLAGLVALLAGSALLVAWLPQAVAEERAFLSASACRGTPTEDCLHSAWFTVESVHVQRGKQPGGWVRLSELPEEGAGRVQFSGLGAFLEGVRPGDRVAGTIWRGEIVVLSDSVGVQRTVSHPVGDPLLAAGSGILLVMGGGLCIYVSRQRLRSHEPSARPHRTALTAADACAVAGLGACTFTLMVVLHDRDGTLGALLALWIPAAAAVCAFLNRRHLRHRTRR
ncbi:hypothetical protein I2W78_13175 [Streptomyces spinoverrucosus]|uniref:hypothetical protein n=1 Tax=Streptomyces spinoverrucosus TaxID=284043 RepID=UPI0018C36634|nr:hypothetical protein [Streptomyces spinoverrucosus]MBG0852764.1 hypothetical protein [Streptomyces spinoverrucosus]